MKTKAIQLTLAGMLVLATLTGAGAADEKKAALKDTRERIDLHKEITSPVGGEFSAAGQVFRSGSQQDFGGISGNANGMDGMPTANNAPSTYPSPGVSAAGY